MRRKGREEEEGREEQGATYMIFSSCERNRAFMGESGKHRAYQTATMKVIAPVVSMKIRQGAIAAFEWRMAKERRPEMISARHEK